jgi:aspartate/methionine/tyrosine aminotransferase
MESNRVTEDDGITQPFDNSLRTEALSTRGSGIAEIFNMGRGRQGLIPLYVGEGDLPAPAFVREAIARSLADGETFYAPQGGLPDLRVAIARYMSQHYGAVFERKVGRFGPERFFVTTGGMHALQLAVRLVAGAGDEVIVPTPAWPNFEGVLTAAGARVCGVPLDFVATSRDTYRWHLELARLRNAITPATRALIVNSPANPTGWTASPTELTAILEIAREFGLWIIADEIYGRIAFSGERAASFHDVMEDGDRIVFVQTFSKNWAMTGLRLGWLEVPPHIGPLVDNLIQYSTSCVAPPIQRAGLAALEQGQDFFAAELARMRLSRDLLCDGLAATGKVRFALPDATFYLFCAIGGGDARHETSRDLALRLIEEANVGVAPGSAFGDGGEGFARISFARSPDEISEAVRRLKLWFATKF